MVCKYCANSGYSLQQFNENKIEPFEFQPKKRQDDIDDEIDIVYLKHEKATLSKMGEKFLDNLVKEVTFDN